MNGDMTAGRAQHWLDAMGGCVVGEPAGREKQHCVGFRCLAVGQKSAWASSRDADKRGSPGNAMFSRSGRINSAQDWQIWAAQPRGRHIKGHGAGGPGCGCGGVAVGGWRCTAWPVGLGEWRGMGAMAKGRARARGVGQAARAERGRHAWLDQALGRPATAGPTLYSPAHETTWELLYLHVRRGPICRVLRGYTIKSFGAWGGRQVGLPRTARAAVGAFFRSHMAIPQTVPRTGGWTRQGISTGPGACGRRGGRPGKGSAREPAGAQTFTRPGAPYAA